MIEPRRILIAMVLAGFAGCTESATVSTAPAKPKEGPQVVELNPQADNQVANPKQKITDPLTAPLTVYQNTKVVVPQLAIEHALNLFNASEGRYPESFEEFMTRIVKENQIALPDLPAGMQFQYDVANHKLLVIQVPSPDGSAKQAP